MGEDDPFDYVLALRLKTSHAGVGALPNDEYVRWRAFLVWEAVQREHAADVAAARARR